MTITKADVSNFTFAQYRKIGTTNLSNEVLPVGTKVQTLEGEYTCAEPSRLAIDAAGNVYPVAESIFRKSYELVGFGARAASAPSPGAQGGTEERARVEPVYSSSGIPDPERPGRVLNPFDATENPTFLPGDKVRDKRDCTRKIWRIIARQAYLDSEYITLRDVDDDANERRLVAKTLIPYLEMVAMMQRYSAASPLDAGAQGGTEGAGKP